MKDRPRPRLLVLAQLRAVDVVDMEPATIAEHEGINAAWALLERSGCQFIPVVRDGRVVGVIEEHTLVAAKAHGGLHRTPWTAAEAAVETLIVHASTPLAEVVAAIRRTPTEVTLVVDDEGRLIGAISTSHLVTLLDKAMDER
jgi:CBS domain-containing protein